MIKKITFMRVALSFVIAICFGFLSASSMRVYAYTSEDNFYPIVTSSAELVAKNIDGTLIYDSGASLIEDGKYYYDNGVLRDVFYITWQTSSPETVTEFTFPYEPSLYDYYLVGTMTAKCVDSTLSTFKPSKIEVVYMDVDSNSAKFHSVSNTNIYDIDNAYFKGFGFSTKIDFSYSDNIGITYLGFVNDKDGSGDKPANLVFEAGILAVDKTSSESAALSQILNQLVQMESSMLASIQSSADQLTGSIDSASNSITSKLQESFDSLTLNLSDWFNDVFNGYDGTGTSEASEKFDQIAGELESVEKDLTNITNTSVDNYATSAFDSSIITTLGPSLVYVVTWFTNFWNMGGIFTSLLNVGLALFVAFFILRLHGGK